MSSAGSTSGEHETENGTRNTIPEAGGNATDEKVVPKSGYSRAVEDGFPDETIHLSKFKSRLKASSIDDTSS